MEIGEILIDSESELEREFDDLDLYSMDDEEDEENNNSAPSTRKRHAPRKWRSSGFDPKDLKFSDRASGVREEFEVRGNKPSDYFRAFFYNELMQKIVEETNNYQQQNATSNVGKTTAWYNTTVEEEGKLRKIQSIVEYLRNKFERAVIPWENLCIDESPML